MGISTQQWRCRVGCFSQPGHKSNWKMPGIKLLHKRLMIRVVTLCCLLFIVSASPENMDNDSIKMANCECSRPAEVFVGSGWIPNQTMPWLQRMVSPLDMSTNTLCTCHHTSVLVQRLMLCGDVELNPGPKRKLTQEDSGDDSDDTTLTSRAKLEEVATSAVVDSVQHPVNIVGENEKRWLVFGFALNKIVVPELRRFVEDAMKDLFANLYQPPHSIGQQTQGKQLRHHPLKTQALPPNALRYENINSNEQIKGENKRKLWNYSVVTSIDFAKLFLQPFMAKCSSFTDCDASILLALVKCVDDSMFKDALRTMRIEAALVHDIRNTWAHCHFNKWDKAMFEEAFRKMENLLHKLNAGPGVHSHLQEIKINGFKQFSGQDVQSEMLIKMKEAAAILAQFVCNHEEGFENVHAELETLKDRINTIESETTPNEEYAEWFASISILAYWHGGHGGPDKIGYLGI